MLALGFDCLVKKPYYRPKLCWSWVGLKPRSSQIASPWLQAAKPLHHRDLVMITATNKNDAHTIKDSIVIEAIISTCVSQAHRRQSLSSYQHTPHHMLITSYFHQQVKILPENQLKSNRCATYPYISAAFSAAVLGLEAL